MISPVPVRYLIVTTLCVVAVTTILNRSNLYITIVSMVVQHEVDDQQSDLCPALLPHNKTPLADPGLLFKRSDGVSRETSELFDWSPELQGSIMGCFFWMYFLCQIPSGYISDRFGARLPMAISLLATGLISIATPTATGTSVWLLIFLRVLMGVFQAAIFPGIFVIICNWLPVHERSMALAVTNGSAVLSDLALQFATGYMIKAWGWSAMFYAPGILSIAAFAVVTPYLRNKPDDHPGISAEELAFIKNQGTDSEPLEDANNNSEDVEPNECSRREAVPWFAIVTNGPVAAAFLFKFAGAISSYMMSSETPAYFANVLHMDITEIGQISAISNLMYLVGILVTAKASEELIIRGWMSKTNSRKLCSIFSGTLSAVSVVLMSLLRCSKTAVVAMFYVNSTVSSFSQGADSPIAAEMTNKYRGVLFAVFQVACVSPGFIAPMYSGAILSRVRDHRLAWDIIFYTTSGFLIVANILFLLFGSARVQLFDRNAITRKERPGNRTE